MKKSNIKAFEVIINNLYVYSKKISKQLNNDSDLRFLRWADTWLIVRDKNDKLSLDERLLKELMKK